MVMDKLWKNREVCEAYVEQQEKNSLVKEKEREVERKIISSYLRNEDKVQVGLGIGGGLDFDILKDNPKIKRRIGVDNSLHMLRLCRKRYPDADLLRDDIRKLEKLEKVLKNEERPIIFTLLTNTLGNFGQEDRKKVVRATRRVMKENDLLVVELYKRPELLPDPGLVPTEFIDIKVREIDLQKGKLSEPIPLLKSFPFNYFLHSPQYAWMLHSIFQQEHYGELKVIQKVVGKIGHAAYWPETGDIVIYTPRKRKKGETRVYSVTIKSNREEFEKYFKPVLVSHRWEGMEMASTFYGAGLLGDIMNGEYTFILFLIPFFEGKENLIEFERRYNSLFL